MSESTISDRPQPLAAFVDAIATHLARVLNTPATTIVPLVRLNTLHRKPNQGAFVVPIKALAQLNTAPTSSSPSSTTSAKSSTLDATQIQRCLQLDASHEETPADVTIRRLFVSVRHVKDLLHFDPDPVQILQRTIQSVQHDYKASLSSSPSSLSCLAVTSAPSVPQASSSTSTDANRKRTRASGDTVIINGTMLKHDEDPYTSLRRVVMTTVLANVESSQHQGDVKVYLEHDGLDFGKAVLPDDAAQTSHLAVLHQRFTTTTKLKVIQKEDKSWHVDLSGAGLNSVKIYESTSNDDPGIMEGPALATQTLAMLLTHFEQNSCEKYLWVVSEGRQMLASQVLQLAEKLSEEAGERDPWSKNVQLITFGPASGPDVWKKDSALPAGVPGIATSALNQTRRAVQEKEEKISEALECEESDEVLDEASLETMVAALAHSAIVMSCLSNKRSKRLALDIDSTVTQRGNTGVFLQYVIERKANVPLDFNADLQLVKQHTEGINLALALAEWPEMQKKLQEAQDPYVLSSYLFALAGEVGQANRVLRVKGMDTNLAKARWLLFWAAKYRLGQGLRLCGLDLVERM
ncbi:Arginyl-tRNA synthetase [Actinomortierella ambigua]|nr:Arginyl-tRNA synthetase [Actinomortierella ambigua]